MYRSNKAQGIKSLGKMLMNKSEGRRLLALGYALRKKKDEVRSVQKTHKPRKGRSG
jgi:hypothetical protein